MRATTSGLTPTRRLGAGGEAEVFEVAERPGLAFKRFRAPTSERAAKLRVMLDHPPEGARVAGSGAHVAIAWPEELVTGADGVVEGFLMPRIDLTATVPLFQVYNPASRATIAPAFTWRYLLRTARNVAAIVDSLHKAGYVVGDINESNILVNRRALAVLVDCDSMQVRDPVGGATHRGGVGKPEFTAPELQGRDLSTVDRTDASDDFAVAILVFQLLLEGVHPFAGIWNGRGEPPDIPARMRDRHFPYRRGAKVSPPPRALDLDVLPPELRRLAWRTFTTGVRRPAARPSAAMWVDALERADGALRSCARSPHHVFGEHRRRCPWCERLDAGLPDPFPGPTGRSSLTPLPPRWMVRTRSAVHATLSSVAAATSRRVRIAVVRAVRWTWSRLRGPLTWPVPLALAFATFGALVPLGGLLVFCVRSGAVMAPNRTRMAWVRVGLDVAGALVAGGMALAMLHRGLPPAGDLAATSSGLLAFGSRFGRGSAPRRLRAPAVAGLWLAVGGGGVALALSGPVWWPFA